MLKSWYLKYFLVMSGLFSITIGYNNCANDATFDLREGVSSLEEFYNQNDPNYVPPAPKITINNGASYTNEVLVNLTLDPDQNVSHMKISNSHDCSDGLWEAFSSNKTWDLSGKNGKIAVYAQYRYQDDPETDCVSDDIIHDEIAPTVAFVNALTTHWVAHKNLNIKYTATDSISGIKLTECDKAGNGQFAKCGTDIYFNSMVENQDYRVVVRATDNAGNISQPIQLTWKSDQSAPTIVFNSTPGAKTSNTTPSFSYSGTDLGSGIKGYECKLDGGNFVACSNQYIVNPALQDGSHSFSVRAIDNVGRVSDVITHNWIQDSAVPTIQFTQTPSAVEKVGSATFAFSPVMNLTGDVEYYCQLDTQAFALCVSPVSLSGLSDGSHTFSVYGKKKDLPLQSEVISYNWKIDSMKPVVTISSRPKAVDNAAQSPFTFSANDPGPNGTGIKEIQCKVDADPFAVCGGAKTFTLAEGSHTVSVRAIDNAGNVSDVISYTWIIDRTGPNINITTRPSNPTKETVASFGFIQTPTTDVIDYFECKLDGAAYSVCVSPKDYTSKLSDGTHIFSVRAYDRAGNVSPVSSYEWLVDTKGPDLSFTLVPDAVVYLGSAAQVRFIGEDPNGSGVKNFECLYNGVPRACNQEITYTINATTVGNHIYQVTAFDNLGNSTTKDVKWSTQYQVIDKQLEIKVEEERPVDILFVIDTSGSMDAERKNLAQKFNGFLNIIKDLDYQIAVTTTDVVGTQDYEDGRLTSFNGTKGPFILDPSYNLAQAQQLFGNRVQNLPKGDSNEQGIFATVRVIQRALDGKNPVNRAFIRNAADLAVVVLSDEDENSTGASVRYKPADFLKFIDTNLGSKKNFTFHSIITRPGDTVCKSNGGAYYGVNYAEVSRLTGHGQPGGAVIGNVCAADYTSQLTDIGQSVKDMKKAISLECTPLDEDNDGEPDMIVTFKGVADANYSAYPGAFIIQGQKIVFDDFLEPGSFKFDFKCNK